MDTLTKAEVIETERGKSVYDWKPTSNLDRKIRVGSNTDDTSRGITKDTLLIPNEEYSKNGNTSGTLVHDDPNLRNGFTQVPNCILMDNRLIDKDCRLYCLLLKYSWQERRCFPGQELLAQDLNCAILTIKRGLKRLEKLKLIRIERRGLGKVNIYHIRRLTDAYPSMVD